MAHLKSHAAQAQGTGEGGGCGQRKMGGEKRRAFRLSRNHQSPQHNKGTSLPVNFPASSVYGIMSTVSREALAPWGITMT